MTRANPPSVSDPGVACLVVPAAVHGVAARADQIVHEYGRPGEALDLESLVRAARRLGLKSRVLTSTWQRLAKTQLPVIAEDPSDLHFIVGKVSDTQVLIQDPLEGPPGVLTKEEFLARWTGRIVLLTRRASLNAALRQFDFSWFIPAILKYRRLLGEVLIASFALQLFALATPIFFQVVIDKVLVHRGLSTLDVLCVGLLVVSVFEVVLGLLRTYVLSHTTNRIDVRLGADLFRHLLRLPVAYFEARRVGDTVARVRELDSIRGFLTGSTLTLGIDLVFTVVFFGMLLLYSPMLTWVVAGQSALLCAVGRVGHAGLPRQVRGEVQSRGRSASVLSRNRLQHRNLESQCGRTPAGPALGGIARRLSRRQFPHLESWQYRGPRCRPGAKDHHGSAPLARRALSD